MLFCFVTTLAHAVENPNDTYLYRSECPQVGPSLLADVFNFRKCQCTSYVAHKLNERWGNTNPRFTNQYYGFTAWSDAWKWFGRARDAEIGITGARDNFVWDEPSYNAIFPGDVAYWEKKDRYQYGHVAYVEAAGADAYGKGVAWVIVSEYNFVTPPGYEFSRRTIYKSDSRFPDYFLHIDKDRIYCLANPTIGSCPRLITGQQVANGPGQKVGGLGGGSDNFNLKVDFDIMDPVTGQELVAGNKQLRIGQVVNLKVEVEAKDGSTTSHMRPGKNSIEVDYYVRLDDGEWTLLSRQYIQAYNLPSGGKKVEIVPYTIPGGTSEISFKVKIDAEDEAYESHEADNWSRIETFQLDFSWLIPLINLILED